MGLLGRDKQLRKVYYVAEDPCSLLNMLGVEI